MLKDLSQMWVLFLEAGVALALLVFIVWWTLPRKAPGKDKAERRDD